jgi:hypothetical protein
MSAPIEGIITPAHFPLPEFDGQLALLIDAWLREWRSCLCRAYVIEGGISLSQSQLFREPTFEQLAEDDGYLPHLRIYGREELSGARKMLQRLLAGNPNAIGAIAHHLAAEGGRGRS